MTQVFECVINWVKHDVETRKTHLPVLMEHVRLPLMSKYYLIEKVHEEPLMDTDVQCTYVESI